MWPKLRRQIWRWRGVLITAPSVAAVVVGASSAGLFQFLEWATLDHFFRLRPLEPIDQRIVIVTIDESDINYVGQWPMSDARLAQLLQNVQKQQPRAVGLDLYRDLPVEPGNQTLEDVFQSMPNLIGVEKVVGESVAPPPTLKKLNQVALADLVLDADGKVRRGLISVKTEEQETKVSLGVTLALMYLQKEGVELQIIDANQQHYQLGQAVFMPLRGNEGGYVRGDAGGYQILLNFRGPQRNFQTISMQDILENKIPPDLMRDRIVLIGATAPSLKDLFFTPYTSTFFGIPQMTPGVVIHANFTSQILSAALEGRSFIHVWPDSIEWLWILAWSFIGAAGSWILRQIKLLKQNVSLGWLVQAVSIFVATGLLIGGSYLAFLESWWFPVAAPFVALSVSAIATAAYHSRMLQRESERKLAQFLEAMPVGVAVLDANGKPCYANQTAQQLLGQGVFSTPNNHHLSPAYPHYIAGTSSLYPTDNLPVVRALKGERSIADDIEIHLADRIIPIEARGIPIFDEDGNIAFALVAFQDITERKKAEAEREQFTKELFDLNQNLEQALDAELELTDAYGRFVPHEFLYFLGYESIVDVKLGDAVLKEMSILFSDIRDFTSLSEQMTPEDNFKFINAFLSRMEPAIKDNNGFIDKYIGDAIMALFSGSADDALKAGIAMLKTLSDYNTTRQRPGRPPFSIGIGINTGNLMLGTVGGESRMNSTVIGDAVNLASRIEGLTKNYGASLLISHHTFSRLHNHSDYCIRLIDSVKVKGKSEMVSVFEVFDADPPELRAAKLATLTMFERGLLFYSTGEFKQAEELFHDCLSQNPKDRVAQIYQERCQHHYNR